MAPQRRPTVGIERHDLALPPHDQFALAIKLDENRRSGSERKFPRCDATSPLARLKATTPWLLPPSGRITSSL